MTGTQSGMTIGVMDLKNEQGITGGYGMSKAVLIYYAKYFLIGLVMGGISAFLCYSCHASFSAKEARTLSKVGAKTMEKTCVDRVIDNIDSSIEYTTKMGELNTSFSITPTNCDYDPVVKLIVARYTKLGYKITRSKDFLYIYTFDWSK
jgi:hypothetical protein